MNKLKKMLVCIFLTILASTAFAGGTTEKQAENAKPVIAVSILPQQYFIERIGSDRISAFVLVGPGQDPHSYDPTPRQMVALSQARAWILSSTDFEIGLKPKIASQYPNLLIIDGTKGVTFRYLEAHHHEESGIEPAHTNTENGSHDGSIDRHTWLGSDGAKIMATHIYEVLVTIDPEGKEIYKTNYLALIKDIDSVFGKLKKELAPLSGKTVLVFHPAFGYFLDEFGISQEAVETGGKEPTAKALSSLIEEARKDKPPAIFVQTQFPVSAAKTVADAVGAEVIMLDPLDPNWLANITNLGDSLKKALLKIK